MIFPILIFILLTAVMVIGYNNLHKIKKHESAIVKNGLKIVIFSLLSFSILYFIALIF